MTLILPRELTPLTLRVNPAYSHTTLTPKRESHNHLTSTNTSNSHRTLGLSREDRDSTLGLSPPLVRARVPRVTTLKELWITMFDTPNNPEPEEVIRARWCGAPLGAALAILVGIVVWVLAG